MSTPSEQELRAFVGPRADYDLKKWLLPLTGSGKAGGLNRAAFLLSGLWLPYRKMYRIAAIFFGVFLLET